MYKFTSLVVLLLAACAVPIHAAADVEIAWQEYLVNHFLIIRMANLCLAILHYEFN